MWKCVRGTHLVIDIAREANELYRRDGTDRYMYQAPALMIFHASRWGMSYQENAHLVCHHAMLSAVSLGLGTTIIGMIAPVVDRAKCLRTRYGIPDDHRVLTSLIMGYPKYRYRQGIHRDGIVIDESRYLTDAIVEETKTLIASAQRNGKPFFAYLPFSAPHTPFQARRVDYDRLAEISDHNQRVYLAMIRRLDWAIGELTRFLEQTGLAENTLIVFASDNGGATYTKATDNGPLRDGKFTQFEGGLAIPMMMYWPGGIATDRVSAPVMLTDVLPTLVNLLGLPLPTDRIIDGQDLLQAQRETALTDRPLYWRSDFNRAVRFHQWKLLHNKKTNSIHLFDLRKDIGELRNTAHQHPDVVKRLMTLLDEWERELMPPRWPRVMDYFTDDDGEGLWFAI